jgi:HEPN domain-containing protein
MPPDPARVAEARPWFVKAEHDLRAAGVPLAATPPLLGEATYHCQQAAEKSMKGYLSWHDVPIGKTHDLAAIGGLCVANDVSLEAMCGRADDLSVFAWAFRYPGDPEEPTRTEVEDALALAREVYEAMLAKLPPELRP